jgi:hypothetical protein
MKVYYKAMLERLFLLRTMYTDLSDYIDAQITLELNREKE